MIMKQLQSSRLDLRSRNTALMPCCLAELVDMPDQIALQAALLPRFARLRNTTPLVLLCREGSFADAAALRSWCDVVIVRRQGMQDDAQIAQAVGGWWRRQLGTQFAAAMRGDPPLGVRPVRTIFESDVVPCDTGALARSVGCSRELLARELKRSLRGGAFTEEYCSI